MSAAGAGDDAPMDARGTLLTPGRQFKLQAPGVGQGRSGVAEAAAAGTSGKSRMRTTVASCLATMKIALKVCVPPDKSGCVDVSENVCDSSKNIRSKS